MTSAAIEILPVIRERRLVGGRGDPDVEVTLELDGSIASIEARILSVGRQEGELTVRSGVDVGELTVGTLELEGQLRCEVDLDLDDSVKVSIADSSGEVIASTHATIVAVPSVAHRPPAGVPWNERRHRAQVDSEVGL